jgi:peptidoglycan/xylan/chitin deacetylase (PgdA/CDA1 family)
MLRGSPVLMYHGVGEPPPRVAEEGHYNVDAAELARQLDRLSSDPMAPRRVISLDALLAGGSGVVLTFDDGERSVLTDALPALRARGLPAILYVSSGLLGLPGYLAPSEVREIAAGGMTVGAHGHTHRLLSDLPDGELADELRRSRETLAELLGAPVGHMSLPGGRGGARVIEAARRAGFASVATSRAGLAPMRLDAYAIPRMPVNRGLPDPAFEALCAGAPAVYARAIARERTLGLAKSLLGNRRYDALRERARRLLG